MLDLLLVDGQGTATTLSQQLPVTRQAVAKHLGVLDRVGLVRATPRGTGEALPGRRCAARPGRGPAGVGRVGLGRPAAADQADRRGDRAHSTGLATEQRDKETREMVDILHRVGVKTSAPDEVYDALTTVDGLAGWWTNDTTGSGGGRRRDRVPVPAGRRFRHGGRGARPAERVVAGGRRPRGVDRHDDRAGSCARTATTRSCCSGTRAGRSRWSSCTTAAPSGART